MEKVILHATTAKIMMKHKIYTSMARMSSDDERKSVKYGDSSQLTNWILDSGATCHMTPEVADRHHVTAKKKIQYVYKCATIT